MNNLPKHYSAGPNAAASAKARPDRVANLFSPKKLDRVPKKAR